MKRIIPLFITAILLGVSFSCDEKPIDTNDNETEQINKWLSEKHIDVISMEEFLKDTITDNPDTGPDKNRNEYVLFKDEGVYMQIVRRGEGSSLAPGDLFYYYARYVEMHVGTGDTLSHNLYQHEPDAFYVERIGDSYTAKFNSGIMKLSCGDSVPNSWIIAMPFIKPDNQSSGSAKIRLIVPHNQGAKRSGKETYPTFFEISVTKQRGY